MTTTAQRASMDQMITEAATYWDGCDDVQYEKESAVLEAQVEAIYEAQHQPWHEGMFEPDVVRHWIRTTIKNRALPLEQHLERLAAVEDAIREAEMQEMQARAERERREERISLTVDEAVTLATATTRKPGSRRRGR